MSDVLILHGWGSGAKNWGRVRGLLENQGYRVFLPDLPGFGEAHLPPQPWSVNDYMEWVNSYCEKQKISPFFLLGHSFGGSIAVKFALKHPEKIKKLFLIDSAGIRKKTIKIEIIKKIASIFKKFAFFPGYSLIRKFFYKIIKSDYLYITRGIMKETLLKVLNEDLSKDFSGISVPTVIIWGKKDNLIPLKYAYYIKEEIFGAKLEILPGIYHNPQSENPELLAKKILSYIE